MKKYNEQKAAAETLILKHKRLVEQLANEDALIAKKALASIAKKALEASQEAEAKAKAVAHAAHDEALARASAASAKAVADAAHDEEVARNIKSATDEIIARTKTEADAAIAHRETQKAKDLAEKAAADAITALQEAQQTEKADNLAKAKAKLPSAPSSFSNNSASFVPSSSPPPPPPPSPPPSSSSSSTPQSARNAPAMSVHTIPSEFNVFVQDSSDFRSSSYPYSPSSVQPQMQMFSPFPTQPQFRPLSDLYMNPVLPSHPPMPNNAFIQQQMQIHELQLRGAQLTEQVAQLTQAAQFAQQQMRGEVRFPTEPVYQQVIYQELTTRNPHFQGAYFGSMPPQQYQPMSQQYEVMPPQQGDFIIYNPHYPMPQQAIPQSQASVSHQSQASVSQQQLQRYQQVVMHPMHQQISLLPQQQHLHHVQQQNQQSQTLEQALHVVHEAVQSKVAEASAQQQTFYDLLSRMRGELSGSLPATTRNVNEAKPNLASAVTSEGSASALSSSSASASSGSASSSSLSSLGQHLSSPLSPLHRVPAPVTQSVPALLPTSAPIPAHPSRPASTPLPASSRTCAPARNPISPVSAPVQAVQAPIPPTSTPAPSPSSTLRYPWSVRPPNFSSLKSPRVERID